jgi:mannose-6-phosphate isomerase-like protein (cupin superfamily)
MKIDAATAEHYLWGNGCDGWHLVRTPDLSIILERMPPEAREQRHFHQHARQFFFVLEGELTVEVEGVTHLLRPAEGVEIAPGQRRQADNRSGNDVRFLLTSQPPSHGDRVMV